VWLCVKLASAMQPIKSFRPNGLGLIAGDLRYLS